MHANIPSFIYCFDLFIYLLKHFIQNKENVVNEQINQQIVHSFANIFFIIGLFLHLHCVQWKWNAVPPKMWDIYWKQRQGHAKRCPWSILLIELNISNIFHLETKRKFAKKKNWKLEEKRVTRFLLSGSHHAVILPTLWAQ